MTVAEFVETEDHIKTYRALNIQFAQGFGASKPIPLSEHLTMLSNKA